MSISVETWEVVVATVAAFAFAGGAAGATAAAAAAGAALLAVVLAGVVTLVGAATLAGTASLPVAAVFPVGAAVAAAFAAADMGVSVLGALGIGVLESGDGWLVGVAWSEVAATGFATATAPAGAATEPAEAGFTALVGALGRRKALDVAAVAVGELPPDVTQPASATTVPRSSAEIPSLTSRLSIFHPLLG